MPVGKHPRVCSLMTGVFNRKPPKPRYTFVWDVSKVLSYLNSLPPNDSLSVKDLTHKLTMLLALTAAARCSEICHLNIQYMVRLPNKYVFTFEKLIKSWRRGKSPQSVVFVAFPRNDKLCVVNTLDCYIKISKPWRENNNQLLLSTVNPHSEVQKSTVAGWIKTILKASGIDEHLFQAHSSRAASSSKARVNGFSIQDILRRGNWSKESTWQKHYHKFVTESAETCQNSVMSSTL